MMKKLGELLHPCPLSSCPKQSQTQWEITGNKSNNRSRGRGGMEKGEVQWELCDTCDLATLIVDFQYIQNVIKAILLAARAGSI